MLKCRHACLPRSMIRSYGIVKFFFRFQFLIVRCISRCPCRISRNRRSPPDFDYPNICGFEIPFDLNFDREGTRILYGDSKRTNLIPTADVPITIKLIVLRLIVHQFRFHDHVSALPPGSTPPLHFTGMYLKFDCPAYDKCSCLSSVRYTFNNPPGIGVSPSLCSSSFVKLKNRITRLP